MSDKNAEFQSIRVTVGYYIDGVHNGDIDLLKKAFHPHAMMYGASGNNITMVEIQGLYDYIASHEAPSKTGEAHTCTITRIQHAGNAAMVEVDEQSLYGNDYTNYLQLLKVDGTWVIVCKSYNATASITEKA